MNKHRIIEKLIKQTESRLNELEEQDALNLLKAYKYIGTDVPFSMRLFNKLNQTISDQALSNPDDVSMGFIVKYLSSFFDIPRNRGLPSDIYDKWVELLNLKIQQSEHEASSVVFLPMLSKILIKRRDNKILTDYIAKTLKLNGRVSNFETINLALYSLKGN